MIQEFIERHINDDVSHLALQRNRYSDLTDTDFSFALQQIEGRQRTREKLPFLAGYRDWWFPKRLSTEQCSSETTARYKCRLLEREGAKGVMVDLTGGMGIDTMFMAGRFEEIHYVERDEELCRLAEHNTGLLTRGEGYLEGEAEKREAEKRLCNINVHCAEAGEYLRETGRVDFIYIDPARRAVSGKKVYRLEDCDPNVVEMMPALREKCSTLLLKLSPMIDISAAVKALGGAAEVHVVAVRGEVKEILVYIRFRDISDTTEETEIHCVNLETEDEEAVFTQEEEREAECEYAEDTGEYVYEPNAAILKAGGFKTMAKRYGLKKMGVNTHLYTGERVIEGWPGRVWRIAGKAEKRQLHGRKMNILARNYPLSAEEIRKRYGIKDGGEAWLIATRRGEEAVMLMAERVRKSDVSV